MNVTVYFRERLPEFFGESVPALWKVIRKIREEVAKKLYL